MGVPHKTRPRRRNPKLQGARRTTVAHGLRVTFTQIEGVDYDETFAPVAKFVSLSAILALAAEHDLETEYALSRYTPCLVICL